MDGLAESVFLVYFVNGFKILHCIYNLLLKFTYCYFFGIKNDKKFH